MPIENIETNIPTLFNQPPESYPEQGTTKIIAVILSLTTVLSAVMPHDAQAKKRPTPSGDTCREKMAFYSRQNALKPGLGTISCKKIPGLLNSLEQIENAGRYFDYNPVGAVAVSACESGLRHNAVGIANSRDKGLFQQHSPYWSDRLVKTKKYIKEHSGPSAAKIKLPDNYFSAKSNSFVSVLMLRRGAGPTDWLLSMPCWNKKYDEVAGSKTKLSNWLALAERE